MVGDRYSERMPCSDRRRWKEFGPAVQAVLLLAAWCGGRNFFRSLQRLRTHHRKLFYRIAKIAVIYLFKFNMLKEKWKRTWSKMTQLEDYTPDVFVKCQWQTGEGASVAYVIYRWMFATVFCCGLLASLFDIGRETTGFTYLKWPVYLTNWGYTVCTIQALMAAFHVTQYYNSVKYFPENVGEVMKMKASYSVYWILHTTAVVGAIGITSIYWTAVYNPEETKLDIVNLTVHLFNSVLMIIDLCIVAHPTKLLHCYWALSFASCYIIFNGLYYLSGGTDRKGRVYIYRIMDWRRPLRTVLASVTSLAFLMLVTVAVWFFSICRRRFAIYLLKRWSNEISKNIDENRSPATGFQTDNLRPVGIV